MPPTADEKTVLVNMTGRILREGTLESIRNTQGVNVTSSLQGKPEESFLFEVGIQLKTRTALAALSEVPGLTLTSANLTIPLRSRSKRLWSNDWYLSLRRGTEAALNGETELQTLASAAKITPEIFEQANWILKKTLQLLRRT